MCKHLYNGYINVIGIISLALNLAFKLICSQLLLLLHLLGLQILLKIMQNYDAK